MKRLLQALRCAVLLVAAGSALAHELGVSRGEYRYDGDQIEAELVFANPELAATLPMLDADRSGRVDVSELALRAEPLREWLRAGLAVDAGGRACSLAVGEVALGDADGLRFGVQAVCAPGATAPTLRFDLFETLTPGHRHIATLRHGAHVEVLALHRRAPQLQFAAATDVDADVTPSALLALGVEHIATGYDHLVFLFGLILVASRLRRVIGVITAFTVGHSLTLAIATLGWWLPDARVVEPLIALSIVYVGIENQWRRGQGQRWLLALGFGLVHGFGFAGILGEIALPRSEVPMALFSFNLGVELGQLVILGVVLPVVAQLRRQPWFERIGVPTLNAAIVVAGAAWLVERVT
jgi:uncharacterized membrane protein YecN with MAPEG domain